MSPLKRETIAGIFLALILLSPGIPAQTVTETAKDARHATPQDKNYFSLAHFTFEEMDDADIALARSRENEIRKSALIYGYDLSAASWRVEQGVCPQLPDTLLLHYLDRYSDGTQSLFTALVPRSSGRVRIVPVLHRNAVPFKAAAANPKNYELFNSLIPAAVAKHDSVPGGEWLSMGVCYAEMVGGKPNVPRDPSVDKATINAPAATIYVDAVTGRRNIRFPDREAGDVVKMWFLSLDLQGHVIGASYEDNATYAAKVVQPPTVKPTMMPAAPDPPSRIITHIPEPPVKITSTPNL